MRGTHDSIANNSRILRASVSNEKGFRINAFSIQPHEPGPENGLGNLTCRVLSSPLAPSTGNPSIRAGHAGHHHFTASLAFELCITVWPLLLERIAGGPAKAHLIFHHMEGFHPSRGNGVLGAGYHLSPALPTQIIRLEQACQAFSAAIEGAMVGRRGRSGQKILSHGGAKPGYLCAQHLPDPSRKLFKCKGLL